MLRFTAAQRKDFIRAALAGESFDSIGARLGVCGQCVRYHLYRAGYTPRLLRAARAAAKVRALGNQRSSHEVWTQAARTHAADDETVTGDGASARLFRKRAGDER